MTPAIVEWTEDRIATLKCLWPDQTLSHAAIAEACGTSRTAVVAKGRRVGLPALPRPSCVKPRDRRKAIVTTSRAGRVIFLPPLPVFTPSPAPPSDASSRIAALAEEERLAIEARYGAIVRVAA